MFNQVQRFSIRKLTVGAASVLIGVSFMNVMDNNHVKAATENANEATSETVNNNDQAQNKNQEQVLNVKKNTTEENSATILQTKELDDKAQNQVTSSASTDNKVSEVKEEANTETSVTPELSGKTTNKEANVTAAADKKEESDSQKDQDRDYKITINYVNDKTGKSFDTTSFTAKSTDIERIKTDFVGLKLMNPEALDGLKVKFSSFISTGFQIDKDLDITLHYAPLAPVKIQYVDDNGNLLMELNRNAQKSTAESPYSDLNDIHSSTYDAYAIDIPGYELVSAPTESIKFDKVENGTDPNYNVIKFVYKSVESGAGAAFSKPKQPISYSDKWDVLPGGFSIDKVSDTYSDNKYESRRDAIIEQYQKQGFTNVDVVNNHKDSDKMNRLESEVQIGLYANKPVIVDYVDESGNKVADSEVLSFNKNNPDQTNNGINHTEYWNPEGEWTSSPKDVKGYTLDHVNGATKGKFASFDYTVTYVYKKNAPKVETETKDYTRTIHYVYQDGTTANPDKIETVTLTRTKTTDPVTDKVTYSDWSKGNYSEVVSPEIKGYTADKKVVESIPATKDETETVTYSKNPDVVENESKQVTRTIHYVYQDGTTAKPDKTETVTLTRTKTTDPVTDKVTYSDWSKGNYSEVVSPEIKGYTADKKVVESIPATKDETETVTYSKNPDVVENESKQVTRTIHYVYQDGTTANPDKTETVTLTRTKTTDPATDKVTYSDWSKGNYSEVVSPEIKGYTADKKVVESIPATKDETETVTYTSVTPVIPVTPVDPNPEPQPQPENPTTPDIPAPHGEDVPTKPEQPENPATPDVPAPHGEDIPTAPQATKPVKSQVQKTENIPSVENVPSVKEESETVKPHAEELPQTGIKDNETAAAIGLAMVGISGLLTAAGTRKRRKN